MAKFIIFSLPRSRSFWLSRFLSYGPRSVGHDLLVESSSIKDFEELLAEHAGSCETAAMVGWKLIVQRMPELKLFVIRRDVDEVEKSFLQKGYRIEREFLEGRAAMLDALSNVRGVRTFSYSDLNREEVCKELFEECTGTLWDKEWWLDFKDINIQIDFDFRIQEINEKSEALAALSSEVLAETVKLGSAQCLHLN